ncbi:Threonine synthase-like 2 [Bulinus truncatus]|nr:Threonine synthase-like 2 [Bulinus truncatus]
MKYHSTRGGVKDVDFKGVLLTGYAEDEGMFLPQYIPKVSSDILRQWSSLSYEDLAYQVTSLYIEEKDIPSSDLKDIFHQAFSTFSVPDIVPIKKFSEGLNIAELFHGRSLAFKDLAMSCLGKFYNYFLRKNQQHMTLVVCTSGDTGSSAIEAVRGLQLVDIIVILPRGRCTLIQERQMTTVLDKNVHVFRADGSSDDIDLIVRKLFADTDFVCKHHLASSSSLNFVRILIQMVHFFYIYLKLPNS